MSNIERCWRCRGTGQMDLDRGQVTVYATCIYCGGTGDFQERRERDRRSSDQGAVKERDALRLMLGRLLDVALVDGYGETVRDEAEALLTTTGGQSDSASSPRTGQTGETA